MLCRFFFAQFNSFAERYKRLREYEPDADEEVAGVEIFQRFGFFPTLVNLSRKMGMKYDDVLAMEADTIYMTLLLDFETSEYEKRLMDIKQGKK